MYRVVKMASVLSVKRIVSEIIAAIRTGRFKNAFLSGRVVEMIPWLIISVILSIACSVLSIMVCMLLTILSWVVCMLLTILSWVVLVIDQSDYIDVIAFLATLTDSFYTIRDYSCLAMCISGIVTLVLLMYHFLLPSRPCRSHVML